MIENSKKYWRSLDELEDTPEFRQWVEREFPEGITEAPEGVSRRRFLTMMAASMALAGLSACRRPVEKLVPYVVAPEASQIPGIPKFYATAMPFSLDSFPLLVRSNDGRPTKIEGNKEHDLSKGATNVFAQASILDLYDQDRLTEVLKNGEASSWSEFVHYWRDELLKYGQNQGEGLALLMAPFNSPSLKKQLSSFKLFFPKAVVAVYEPFGFENLIASGKALSGENVLPNYYYENAKVVLSVDADVFSPFELTNVRATKGFSKWRRLETEADSMNRLYVVESGYTITGAMADHRVRLASSQVGGFLLAVIAELARLGLDITGIGADVSSASSVVNEKVVREVAKDLFQNRGSGIIVAGMQQSVAVHGLCLKLNEALGNIGQTVVLKKIDHAEIPSTDSLKMLTEKMLAGSVKTLIVTDVNPVYDAPADVGFTDALKKVSSIIRFANNQDEMAKFCTWNLPKSHYLETWGDVAYLNGQLGIIQPLIAPLYHSKSLVELFTIVTTGEDKSAYEIVRSVWAGVLPSVDFEESWRKVVHNGFLDTSKDSERTVSTLVNGHDLFLVNPIVVGPVPSSTQIEINFRPSNTIFDGRFSNNGWLQELPDPITKISWDNSAIMSVKTAKELGLETMFGLSDVMSRQMIELSMDSKVIKLPVWIQPGQADYVITLSVGYGRKGIGRVADNVGVDVFPLRTTSGMLVQSGVKVAKVEGTFLLATTQNHGSMEGRPLVVDATLDEYRKKPTFASDAQIGLRLLEKNNLPNESLWNEVYDYSKGNQWGMVIDLNACTGCNACTIACQSENNIPIVGKEQVAKGRNMHWIRIDRYFEGAIDEPRVVVQPVACHHCENAPCEQVCPVAATVHTEDGLNSMVYNRCVGTRYCANNCPYKVRRFNFFNYATDNPVYSEMPEVMKLAQNPEVSVRFRGVMEKCTYCTQRISLARISRKNRGEAMQDGDVVTACQQACPADAIVFGDINDPESAVSKIKARNRNYEILAELNLKPRTSYLAKLRNPNLELDGMRLHFWNGLVVLLMLACVLVLHSCASIFGRKIHPLTMTSIPKGATVMINGQKVGQTPLKLELRANKDYEIVFEKEGYEPVRRQVYPRVGVGWIVLDVLGGLVPIIVDAVTGDWFYLSEEFVGVWFEPKNDPSARETEE
ncbi:hypothetical protein CHS0354_023979 [Potamilus streckersoni]|uniref:4Fe-4S ferredoxin-type domain-containing protein n=1 Tax=Potamilus streckersoni TaxID=2493646 RepID=A0AAE0VL94_9BIVA|nr:hypothetical protein CHS0354_023979 [Potamilus streckersoni]